MPAPVLAALTTQDHVGITANMAAEPVIDDRYELGDGSFAEIGIWRRPDGTLKYRLAYVVTDVCALRYDNEIGKGDHRHKEKRETAYRFTTMEQLIDDFWTDVLEMQNENRDL
jgi:hypothetical protein